MRGTEDSAVWNRLSSMMLQEATYLLASIHLQSLRTTYLASSPAPAIRAEALFLCQGLPTK